MALFYTVSPNSSPPVVNVIMDDKNSVECKIVNSLIAMRETKIPPRLKAHGKNIVDNFKLLIDSEIEKVAVDTTHLCDELASLTAQVAEIKEKLASVETQDEEETPVEVAKSEDKWPLYEQLFFWGILIFGPVAISISVALALSRS
jgi:hypothetical protein